MHPGSGGIDYLGEHFTDYFLLTNYLVTPIGADQSLQIFAHGMTAQLSCHEQNFEVIVLFIFGWEQNKISIKFE